jgi:hypothetical protein
MLISIRLIRLKTARKNERVFPACITREKRGFYGKKFRITCPQNPSTRYGQIGKTVFF